MRTLSLWLISRSRQHHLHGRTNPNPNPACCHCHLLWDHTDGMQDWGCESQNDASFFPFSATAHETGRLESSENSSSVGFRAHRSLNRCHINAQHFSSLGGTGLLFGNNTGAQPEPGKWLSQLCSSSTTGGPSGRRSCIQPLCSKQNNNPFPLWLPQKKKKTNSKLTTG